MNPFFVLTETIGGQIERQLVFPKDRETIAFGRSGLCEYRLLADRPDAEKMQVSRIQATLELADGQWTLHRGCTERSQRGNIPIGLSKTPFWLEESKITNQSVALSIGSSFYLYRDDECSCLLSCVDEESYAELIADRPLSPDDTRPYDLLGEMQADIQRLESVFETGFHNMQTAIEALYQSDRALYQSDQLHSKRLDTQAQTLFKLGFALVLISFAWFGGTQLFDPSQRKDLFYDFVKLLLSATGGGGGLMLVKNALDNRRRSKN